MFLLAFSIRALVERANSAAPLYYRILNEMILFTSQDKPLPRTLKGTVMRKLALKLYEEEIDSVYVSLIRNSVFGNQPLDSIDTEIFLFLTATIEQHSSVGKHQGWKMGLRTDISCFTSRYIGDNFRPILVR